MSFRGGEEHGDGKFVIHMSGGRSHPHRQSTDNPQITHKKLPLNDP